MKSTRINVQLTFNPEHVAIETRGQHTGFQTKVIPRDDKLAAVLAETILGFEPQESKPEPAAPSGQV